MNGDSESIKWAFFENMKACRGVSFLNKITPPYLLFIGVCYFFLEHSEEGRIIFVNNLLMEV